MILADIKTYLIAHRLVTLGDLAIHFDTDPAAMKAMLQAFVHKGRLRQSSLRACCHKTCGKCADAVAMEIYEWTGGSERPV